MKQLTANQIILLMCCHVGVDAPKSGTLVADTKLLRKCKLINEDGSVSQLGEHVVRQIKRSYIY